MKSHDLDGTQIILLVYSFGLSNVNYTTQKTNIRVKVIIWSTTIVKKNILYMSQMFDYFISIPKQNSSSTRILYSLSYFFSDIRLLQNSRSLLIIFSMFSSILIADLYFNCFNCTSYNFFFNKKKCLIKTSRVLLAILSIGVQNEIFL